uniref:Integrin beta subunit VWA domain-containing protein n=1 Tax=Panagrolaimus sp. ES5 TaxID=591445 RepID=A0AC34FXZ7_9BILA
KYFHFLALIQAEEIEEIRKKCQSEEGLQSCGSCTKQHPECSWCSEPSVTVPRCDHRSAFTRTCPSAANSAGQSEITIPEQHNVPLGNESPRTKQPIQIYPQQVYMRLKPGEPVCGGKGVCNCGVCKCNDNNVLGRFCECDSTSCPKDSSGRLCSGRGECYCLSDSQRAEFAYRHSRAEVRDIAIQTSDLRSVPFNIEFEIDCNGKVIKGISCPNAKPGQEYKFYATVTLKECKSGGTLPVSIGVVGYNDISAIYVTPLCACECEKLINHKKQDYSCNAAGTLICGQCVLNL